MSKKDDFWDDIDDYLSNPYHDARQFEDYDEWMDEKEKIEDGYYREQFEESDDYIDDNIDEEIDNDFDETEDSEDEEDYEDNDLACETNYKADNSGEDLKQDSSNIDKGFFKYYDKHYSSWDLRRALLDNFTELRQKYDSKKFKYKDFEFILENEYKADRSQALKYWEWLLDVFPFDIVIESDEHKDDETAYKIAVKFLRCLLADAMVLNPDEEQIDFLYKYIKGNEKHFKVMFIDLNWKALDDSGILDMSDIIDYYRPFLRKNDYEYIRKMYQAMTENQSAYFNGEIIDDFWETIISIEEFNERKRQGQHGALSYSVGLNDESYEFFMDIISPLGDTAKKSRHLLKDFAPDETIDSIENEIEEIDIEIKGLLYKKEQLLKRLKRKQT